MSDPTTDAARHNLAEDRRQVSWTIHQKRATEMAIEQNRATNPEAVIDLIADDLFYALGIDDETKLVEAIRRDNQTEYGRIMGRVVERVLQRLTTRDQISEQVRQLEEG